MKNYKDIAINAALNAGKIIRSHFGTSAISHKGATYNLVTQADTDAESAILSELKKECPESLFLSEESTWEQSVMAEDLWIVDPLDGTNNFAHTIPHFSVSIAHASKGVVDTGVVFDPMREELFFAQINSGAYLNGKKIQTSAVNTIEKAIIATGFYYDRSELMEMTLAAIHKLFKANIQGIRRMGSAALDMCWLAAGRYDGYFEYMLSPWDFAAGMLIITEAGGTVLDRCGSHNGLLSKGIICSNKSLNQQFVDTVSWNSISKYQLFRKDRA